MRVPVCRIPMEYDLEPQGVYSFLSGGKPAAVSKPHGFRPNLPYPAIKSWRNSSTSWVFHDLHMLRHHQKTWTVRCFPHLVPPKRPWKVCKVEGGRAQLRDGIQTQPPQSCEQFLIASANPKRGSAKKGCAESWDDG